jgi:ergothioneine biosynthesis protein EgtB
VVQSMDDVSPTKWHLAHTSWFFETFVLQLHAPGYRPLNATYQFLFNSYYQQAGERHCRAQRGYISRPTVREVFEYRAHVDAAMGELLSSGDQAALSRIHDIVELGINHEQQHQELMLTDIKHVFSVNPLRPVYRPAQPRATTVSAPLDWYGFEAGVREIGHDGHGFAYDNEGPRHREFLEPFAIASRLVTNGEYLEFMADGGYTRPELWLSAGWDSVQKNQWSEPFYWEQHEGKWYLFTLSGMRAVDEHEPVCHVSYFEADAFARWKGARLPTEAEWEVAAEGADIEGNFAESGVFHTLPHSHTPTLSLFGNAWQWTRSQYSPYPGYQPAPGAVGEYNGKFMCNQFVLRGGSCATSRSHIRRTYRNFFAPDATWQFMGIRLANDGA